MQSYCLMLNLPFIFIAYRSKLDSVWGAMEDLGEKSFNVFGRIGCKINTKASYHDSLCKPYIENRPINTLVDDALWE